MRERYKHDLEALEQQLVALATAVEQAVREAMWALEHHSSGFARQVIANDNAIDERRYQVEQAALNLITLQQPIARDLRIVSSILGLASELERIGDYAEGIAQLVLRSANLPPLLLPSQIMQMATQAQAMLRDAIDALRQRDAQAGSRLNSIDSDVDRLYAETTRWAITSMQSDPTTVERAMYYVWIAHNLERIADRTVNIGERATFIATGIIDSSRQ